MKRCSLVAFESNEREKEEKEERNVKNKDKRRFMPINKAVLQRDREGAREEKKGKMSL